MLAKVLPRVLPDKFDEPPPKENPKDFFMRSPFGPIVRGRSKEEQYGAANKATLPELIDISRAPSAMGAYAEHLVCRHLGDALSQAMRVAEERADTAAVRQRDARTRMAAAVWNLRNLDAHYRSLEARLRAAKAQYEAVLAGRIPGLAEAEEAADRAREDARQAMADLQAIDEFHQDQQHSPRKRVPARAEGARVFRHHLGEALHLREPLEGEELAFQNKMERRTAAVKRMNQERLRAGEAWRKFKNLKADKGKAVKEALTTVQMLKASLARTKEAHDLAIARMQNLGRDVSYADGGGGKLRQAAETHAARWLQERLPELAPEEVVAAHRTVGEDLEPLQEHALALHDAVAALQNRLTPFDPKGEPLVRSEGELREQVQLVGSETELEVAKWRVMLNEGLLRKLAERLPKEPEPEPEKPVARPGECFKYEEEKFEALTPRSALKKMERVYELPMWDGVFDTRFLDKTVFGERRLKKEEEGSTEGYFYTMAARRRQLEHDFATVCDERFTDFVVRTDAEVKKGTQQVEGEIAELLEACHRQYIHIQNCYLYYCVTGTDLGESCFSMRYNRFNEFVKDSDIVSQKSKYCKMRDCQMMFTEVNKEDAGDASQREHNDANDDRALMRFEFLEVVCRLAVAKYGKGQKTDDVSEAVDLLGTMNLAPKLDPEAKIDPNLFRAKRLYNMEMHELFTAQMPFVKALYDFARKTGNKGRLMYIEQWVELLDNAKIIGSETGISRREAKSIFVWGQMPVLEELRNRKRYIGATFVDFLEMLARIAELLAAPTDKELDEFFHETNPCTSPSRLWQYYRDVEEVYAMKHRRESAAFTARPTRPLVVKTAALLEVMLTEFKYRFSAKTMTEVAKRLRGGARGSVVVTI